MTLRPRFEVNAGDGVAADRWLLEVRVDVRVDVYEGGSSTPAIASFALAIPRVVSTVAGVYRWCLSLVFIADVCQRHIDIKRVQLCRRQSWRCYI